MKWEELSMRDRTAIMAAAVRNGYTDIRSIKEAYANYRNQKLSAGNRYSKGGNKRSKDDKFEVVNMLDNLPIWKALENIDYEVIADPEFTRDKTGAGSIEYFSAEEPEGITYTNGYHRDHPMPEHDVILYDPNTNDEQDIRLDALHIMPKDPTYDALNSLYRDASYTAHDDNYQNAERGWKVDRGAQSLNNTVERALNRPNAAEFVVIDPFIQYFNNEADGTLRSLLMEGDEEYRASKRYWPNKEDVRQWNAHLMPHVNRIEQYLKTGKRPADILPELIVNNKNAYGGNLFDGVSGTSRMKRKARPSKGGLGISDYERKKAAYYRNELIKRGITNPVHLDAIIANMAVESTFNPSAADGTGAHGLMQWMGARIPKDMSEKGQLDYIAKTYNHFGGNDWQNKEAYKRFNTTNDPVEAANLMRIYWERCAPKYHYKAGAWLNLYNNNNNNNNTIDTYHPMEDVTWSDVKTRKKQFELTPEEERLANTPTQTVFEPEYQDRNHPNYKESPLAESVKLNDDLYNEPSPMEKLGLLYSLQNGSSQNNTIDLLTTLMALNPKATPQLKENANTLNWLFAPKDNDYMYHGLNFAAYGGNLYGWGDELRSIGSRMWNAVTKRKRKMSDAARRIRYSDRYSNIKWNPNKKVYSTKLQSDETTSYTPRDSKFKQNYVKKTANENVKSAIRAAKKHRFKYESKETADKLNKVLAKYPAQLLDQDTFEKLAEAYVNGVDVDAYHLLGTPVQKHSIPQITKDILQRQVLDRMEYAYRAEQYLDYLDDMPYFRQIPNQLTYAEYPAWIYSQSGNGRVAGFANPRNNGFISARKNYKRDNNYFLLPHEARHYFQFEGLPLTNDQAIMLNRAFDNSFLNIPAYSDSDPEFNNAMMTYERETTNLDTRIALLFHMGRGDLLNKSIEEQNAVIDKASDEDIFDSLENSGGYGQMWVELLFKRQNGESEAARQNRLHLKASDLRNSLKWVGKTKPTNTTNTSFDINRTAYGGKINRLDDGGFTSELDWRPENWLGLRVDNPEGPKYTQLDVDTFNSHVPEYLGIEKNAKDNGTWLQMPDGTTWQGDPRSWVMMQSKAFTDNYSQKPWYTGLARWNTSYQTPVGLATDKVTRAPYYNDRMWFSDNPLYGATFADYIDEHGKDLLVNPDYPDFKDPDRPTGVNFLSAIPKSGNYRYLTSPAEGTHDYWTSMPYNLVGNDIVRLDDSDIMLEPDIDNLPYTNLRGDEQKVLTDDVANWSRDLGDDGIFMNQINDGPVVNPQGYFDYPIINEFISQPGFTNKVKFIEGNNGDFDINNPYKYSYVDDVNPQSVNYGAFGGKVNKFGTGDELQRYSSFLSAIRQHNLDILSEDRNTPKKYSYNDLLQEVMRRLSNEGITLFKDEYTGRDFIRDLGYGYSDTPKFDQDEFDTAVDREVIYFKNRFNKAFDKGNIIPKSAPFLTRIYGIPHINLLTYPIGGSEFPLTGHSLLEGPDFSVDRMSDTPGYNLLTNNCATSTYNALKDIFGNDFDPSTSAGGIWRPIDLPWNVERLAKKIPGAKYYPDEVESTGARRVSIPLTDKYIDNFNRVQYDSIYGSGYEGYSVAQDDDDDDIYSYGGNIFRDGGFSNLPEQRAAVRAINLKAPYNNYEDAVDMEDSAALQVKKFFDKGVSNCTLTASQILNPNRPIGRARTITTDPIGNGYYEVDEDHIVPGTMVIASYPVISDYNPDLTYHSMVVTGFAKEDQDYVFRDGTVYHIKKGEPLVSYSRGKASADNYVHDIPLSVYNDKSEGKTYNRYYRPIDERYPLVMMDGIEVVANKKGNGGLLFAPSGYIFDRLK